MIDYKSITAVGGNDFDRISGNDGSCFIMLVVRVVERRNPSGKRQGSNDRLPIFTSLPLS